MSTDVRLQINIRAKTFQKCLALTGKCPIKATLTNPYSSSYLGSYNEVGSLTNPKMEISTIIRTAIPAKNLNYTIVNKNINPYGSYFGAPNGSGSPIKNKF